MNTNADRRNRPGDEDGTGTDMLPELEGALAFLVRGLEAVQRIRSYPLERAHYLLVRIIEREGPQTIGAAARHLLLDNSTVTRQVTEMERRGLIRKAPHPGDARATLLHVTEKGAAEADAMRAERIVRIRHMLRDWSLEDRRDGVAVLFKLNAALIDVVGNPQEAD